MKLKQGLDTRSQTQVLCTDLLMCQSLLVEVNFLQTHVHAGLCSVSLHGLKQATQQWQGATYCTRVDALFRN